MWNASFISNRLSATGWKIFITSLGVLVMAAGVAAYQSNQTVVKSPTTKDAGNCGSTGTVVSLSGRTVCVPAPSSDLRRFATAESLATYSHRPYADMLNELVAAIRQSQDKVQQPANGPFTIKTASLLATTRIDAGPGKIISQLALTNEEKQPVRVLIDAGTAHLDLVLAPAQRIDASVLLGLSPSRGASILVAGPGTKLVTGNAQAIAGGARNDCVLFERTFDCNYCAGSQCRRGTGGDEASGECVTKEPKRCLLIFEEPKSCTCK